MVNLSDHRIEFKILRGYITIEHKTVVDTDINVQCGLCRRVFNSIKTPVLKAHVRAHEKEASSSKDANYWKPLTTKSGE